MSTLISFLYEESFLPFLDGNDSVEDLIFIGCTNYINKIPDRIKNRKSRIKECFSILLKYYDKLYRKSLGKRENLGELLKEIKSFTTDRNINAALILKQNYD
jgi:hypothetical protein